MNKIIIFMPAYNAEKTLTFVWQRIPRKYKKNTFLIDDCSQDETFSLAKELGIECYKNKTNLGYGGNIKACLIKALSKGGDIIVEMHPDNEYDPSSIEPAIRKVDIKTGMILGNRINAVKNGMHFWKYIPTKILTAIDNVILGTKLADLHQGFRVYTKTMLDRVPFEQNANNYLFSFEIIAQTVFYGFYIYEIPVQTQYTGVKRGATLRNSIIYSLQSFQVLLKYLLGRIGVKGKLFT